MARKESKGFLNLLMAACSVILILFVSSLSEAGDAVLGGERKIFRGASWNPCHLSRMAGKMETGIGISNEMKKLIQEQTERGKAILAEEEAQGARLMKTLAGRSRDEILESIRQFKIEQYKKNTEFRETCYSERRNLLISEFDRRMKERPDAVPALERMKEKVLARMEATQEEMRVFFLKKHQENMAFIDRVKADSSLQGEKLKETLENFFRSQKKDAEEYMELKKQEGR